MRWKHPGSPPKACGDDGEIKYDKVELKIEDPLPVERAGTAGREGTVELQVELRKGTRNKTMLELSGIVSCRFRLPASGTLTTFYFNGRVSYRPAKLKARDLLQLWIGHLVLCLLRPKGVEQVSIHVATDTAVCFRAVEDPAAELTPFLRYYRQGLSEPLHFYPETSYARAKAKTETAAINAARKT